MKQNYQSCEEIQKDFIRQGWSSDITFRDAEINDMQGCISLEADFRKGKKFFVMVETGNLFDSRGEVALYNIKPQKVVEMDGASFARNRR